MEKLEWWLADGEKSLIISFAVLTEYRRVMDGHFFDSKVHAVHSIAQKLNKCAIRILINSSTDLVICYRNKNNGMFLLDLGIVTCDCLLFLFVLLLVHI